jgi:hypothetical protein
MFSNMLHKILVALFWVGTALQNTIVWVWTKVKQLLTWAVSKFINVCRCDR